MLEPDPSPPAPDLQGAPLRRLWQERKRAHPYLRARDAARELGVSEAQLVASGCGESAVRLKGPWLDLLRGVEAADEVMALTRSEHAVHEKTAAFRNVREAQGTALVEGGGVEVRCDLGAWRSGFAVTEETAAGPRDSLQFFDAGGTAVHKIYRTNSTRRAPWESLVRRHRHPDQTPVEEVGAPPAPAPRAAMDPDALRRDWQDLDGEEGLGALLHRFGLGRLEALQRLGAPWAREVTVAAPRRVLEHCAGSGMPLRIRVASPGAVQVHGGPIRRLRDTGPWLNVLDPDFNLHLREAELAGAWVVHLPRGDILAVEAFDGQGAPVASFLAQRDGGRPDPAAWRALVSGLPDPGAAR